MIQSMSRVACCIDNGPMEAFWGLMKREMYYTKKYQTKEELIRAIQEYMDYYSDRVLLVDGLGLSDNEVKMLRNIWLKLSERRLGRKEKSA